MTDNDIPTNDAFGSWAILELKGYTKLAGYITEEEHFGTILGRIDIPLEDGKSLTRYFTGQSVYLLTPVAEQIARGYALNNKPQPVQVYEWRLPELSGPDWDDFDEEEQDEPILEELDDDEDEFPF